MRNSTNPYLSALQHVAIGCGTYPMVIRGYGDINSNRNLDNSGSFTVLFQTLQPIGLGTTD